MLAIKVIRDTETCIYESEFVTVLDKDSGAEELQAHIADCNIKSANMGLQVEHNDMLAAVCYDGATTYLFPGDRCYVTNSDGKTLHVLDYSDVEGGE